MATCEDLPKPQGKLRSSDLVASGRTSSAFDAPEVIVAHDGWSPGEQSLRGHAWVHVAMLEY